MTEDQAKTKWCPLVRIARDEPGESGSTIIGGVNTDALGRTRVPRSCTCIASACMAWRIAPDSQQKPDMSQIGKGLMGFCGAFGPPK